MRSRRQDVEGLRQAVQQRGRRHHPCASRSELDGEGDAGKLGANRFDSAQVGRTRSVSRPDRAATLHEELGSLTLAEVILIRAHDVVHHAWDIERTLSA